jgi:hypothetical protein
MMQERILNIHKLSSSDPEGLVAPKEIWLSGFEEELNSWIKERENVRSEKAVEQRDDEYLR